MEIIPDKRKVVGLIEHAHEGKICLPNFQRDFVWTREEVADLVRSIIRGYFIGSLLLLRCDPNNPPFAPEFLRGANPPYKDGRPELLVLDGQQRHAREARSGGVAEPAFVARSRLQAGPPTQPPTREAWAV